MCGIAGLIYRDRSTPVDRNVLERMTAVLAHRGPDDDGFYASQGVGLGHRRLAIIDPEAGQQPMTDPDSGNVIVYNGEVYNYVELRTELEALGERFRTESDTEVILKAYDRWGKDCLQRLNGMWAFALWDVRRGQLFLARDRLGIKPLYYFADDSRLVFASEIKGLFAAGLSRRPDLELLDVYLALGYIPAPRSFFRDVAKLGAGQYLITDGGRIEIGQYWDLPRIDEGAMRTDQLAICEQFTELLSDAVRISMRSDVPFGAFLSGGLDSACIVTLMARQTPLPVRTFTIGFNESDYDDRELARLVAARMHTAHYEQAVEPDDLERALNEVCLHYDEPFGDSSALPTGHVARLARNHVKMVLTGDGGDEVLSGYTGYLVEKFASVYRRIPALARHTAESALAAVARAARGRIRYGLNRYERMLRTANVDFATRLVSKAAWLDRQTRAAILGGIQTMPVDQVIAEHMKSCPWNDSFYQLMYFNYKISLPDDMLTKVDRMTMAHSLEARVPFLDYRLVELMAQVHKNIKMQGLERKSVLRRTVGRELPPPLLQAPKRGFVAPLGSWFQNKEVTAPLNSRELSQWGMSESAIDLVVAQHRSGQHDHGNAIWMLMVLQKVLAVAPT